MRSRAVDLVLRRSGQCVRDPCSGYQLWARATSVATARRSTMGLLDRLFGRRPHQTGYQDRPPRYERRPAQDGRLSDEQALERYRYLLRTAPPEQIEQAHAEAFAQLTPDQRQ